MHSAVVSRHLAKGSEPATVLCGAEDRDIVPDTGNTTVLTRMALDVSRASTSASLHLCPAGTGQTMHQDLPSTRDQTMHL